jgi:hypothetical protein
MCFPPTASEIMELHRGSRSIPCMPIVSELSSNDLVHDRSSLPSSSALPHLHKQVDSPTARHLADEQLLYPHLRRRGISFPDCCLCPSLASYRDPDGLRDKRWGNERTWLFRSNDHLSGPMEWPEILLIYPSRAQNLQFFLRAQRPPSTLQRDAD